MFIYMKAYVYMHINMSCAFICRKEKKEGKKDGRNEEMKKEMKEERELRQSQSLIYQPNNLTNVIFYLICIILYRRVYIQKKD